MSGEGNQRRQKRETDHTGFPLTNSPADTPYLSPTHPRGTITRVFVRVRLMLGSLFGLLRASLRDSHRHHNSHNKCTTSSHPPSVSLLEGSPMRGGIGGCIQEPKHPIQGALAATPQDNRIPREFLREFPFDHSRRLGCKIFRETTRFVWQWYVLGDTSYPILFFFFFF